MGLGRPPYVWRARDWRNASTYEVTEVEATTQKNFKASGALTMR